MGAKYSEMFEKLSGILCFIPINSKLENAMNDTNIDVEVSCKCGKSKIRLTGKPITRFICHCQICQKVYKQGFADIVVLKKENVHLVSSQVLNFKKFRRMPAVNRGICVSCSQPMVGFMQLAPFINVAFVPAMHFKTIDLNQIVLPFAHSFYHRRVQNIDDNLPKIQGYWPSQVMVGKEILIKFFK